MNLRSGDFDMFHMMEEMINTDVFFRGKLNKPVSIRMKISEAGLTEIMKQHNYFFNAFLYLPD